MNKVEYLKHKVITFLDESQETLSELDFTDKLLPILETYQEQQLSKQKEISIIKEIEQHAAPSKSTLKEKINVFKETLNNSLNSSISNSVFQHMNSLKKNPNNPNNLNYGGNEGAELVDNSRKIFVRAIHTFKAEIEKDLSFAKGDIVEVLGVLENGWCVGKNVKTNKKGYFPSNFVKPVEANNAVK